MKATTVYRTNQDCRIVRYRYPNAADRRDFQRKLIDGLLTAATAVGGFTALVFLMFL
jgi:hypothetical protein